MSDQHDSTPPDTLPAKQLPKHMKCARKGCNELATATPAVDLFDAAEEKVGELRLELMACDAHAAAATDVADFVGAEQWDGVVEMVRKQGKPAPVRKLAKVRWTPLRDVSDEELNEIAMEVASLVGQHMKARGLCPSPKNAMEVVRMYVGLAAWTTSNFELDPAEVGGKIQSLFEGEWRTFIKDVEASSAADLLAKALGTDKARGSS
jgi:hypothetical protein